MWQFIYILVAFITAYVGIQSSNWVWWLLSVMVLLTLLWFTTGARVGGIRELYEDAAGGTSGLWSNIIDLPKNALETVKPSLNHVIDSVSGKNTPDTPQPDSNGNVPQQPTPKEQIQRFLGKDASTSTIDDMANICFYLHTMKGSDPLAYSRLKKTYLAKTS